MAPTTDLLASFMDSVKRPILEWNKPTRKELHEFQLRVDRGEEIDMEKEFPPKKMYSTRDMDYVFTITYETKASLAGISTV